TLSEAGQASVDQNLNYLTMYSVQSGLTEDAYLKSAYGDNMNKSIFKELLTQSILADEYAQVKAETFTYSDEEMDAYYKENADSLDTYDYRVCYINYQTEEKTDEEGNTIEPTEEEIDAAMKEAGASAKAMVSDVRSGTSFNTAAAKYVAETSATAYTEDPDYNRQKDVLGSTVSSSLSSDVSAWILDAARSAGDITSIEIENSGYCVVQFLGRDKGDDSYQTATYRNIQILAKTDKNDDGTDAAPTEEQLNAAKEKADAIVEMWNDGDATADTFAELAAKNSSDEGTKENGGLNEDANRDNLSSALTSWLFDRDRKAGDVGVVEYTDSTGTVVGYEVIYAEGFGQIRWEYQATNTLRSDDYQTWYAEVQENYPAELTEKGKEIPNL
ncbi:MAG: peptidylprolyl isomerase, partial [Ruminiclostridium sp.]|nr:peptidylprolyl isomerase [Ruminiclostridium sp.]